jgi:hypothetical protein
MPAGSVLPHDFARPSDFESFRNGFSGFIARDRFRHKARKIAALLPRDNRFCAPLPGTEQSSGFQFLT